MAGFGCSPRLGAGRSLRDVTMCSKRGAPW